MGNVLISVVSAVLLIPAATQAATFKVTANGFVSSFEDSNATGPIGFDIGDAFDISFLVTDEGPPGFENRPSRPGDEIRYLEAVSGMTGTLGGQSFASRAPFDHEEQDRNLVQINNDLPGSGSHSDSVVLFHLVEGFDAGGFGLSQFRFITSASVFDGSDNFLVDTALTPDKFSQKIQDLPSVQSIQQLVFGSLVDPSQRVSVRVNLTDISTELVAPVPVPAAGLLLFGGLAGFVLCGRAGRSRTREI